MKNAWMIFKRIHLNELGNFIGNSFAKDREEIYRPDVRHKASKYFQMILEIWGLSLFHQNCALKL